MAASCDEMNTMLSPIINKMKSSERLNRRVGYHFKDFVIWYIDTTSDDRSLACGVIKDIVTILEIARPK